MSTIWDALTKAKDGQSDKKQISGTKEITSETIGNLEEIENNNPKEKEGGEMEMENSQNVQVAADNGTGPSRIVQLNNVLDGLKAISGDIEACAIASEDGLVMASNLPSGLEESNVAAMCAVMLSMGERTSAELECGNTEQLFIKGGSGYVVAMRAGDHAVLLVMARKEAKLGLVFLDLSRAAEEVARILS